MRRLILISALLYSAAAAAVSVYPYRMDPRRHPDESRRRVRPPSWDELGRKMHFIAYRGVDDSGFKQYIDKDGLGDFIWPVISSLKRKDIAERIAEIKKRGLYLFNPWGWVPGSGPEGGWRQYYVPESTFRLLEAELGEHWLGMDNGEQDGRYVGLYAGQQVPFGRDRFGQYLNFQRHFERLELMLGNKMSTLVSLNFGHYFLRENCYTMIGAETAQALPNAQVYYSWIRGAGKQYGVPWFGNVSVFNRWGYKAYPQNPASGEASPVKGTSLALMKKLMYSQIFYNSLAVGFESSLYWNGRYTTDGKDELSPVGRIHKGAVEWCEKYGDPGVMHAPVALMADTNSGWSFPRHLYTRQTYMVWGALPYDPGDYLTDGVLDLIYPGYCDASYFRDERGFNVDTPYGDIADCVLSDAPLWMLRQYPVVILAGRLGYSEELRDTLLEYVRGGGELCLTKGNAKTLFREGLRNADLGRGRITAIPGGDWGVEERACCALPVKNENEVPLARPHPLTAKARAALDDVLKRQVAFSTSANCESNGLSVISCRRGKGEWTVCVVNNTWSPAPLELHSNVGAIMSKEELRTPTGERGAVGFAPEIFTNFVASADTDTVIGAGAVRIFRVKTREDGKVRVLPRTEPRANVANAVLALRGEGSIKRQILARPTFFRHYGGVMIDWTYLRDRDKKALADEKNYLDLQQVRVIVDISGGFNHFPDLRLVKNDPKETRRTDDAFTDVLEKMRVIGARDLLIALGRYPETNMTREDADRSIRERLAEYSDLAAKYGVKLHLRQSSKRLNHEPQICRKYLADGKIAFAPSLAAMSMSAGGKRNLVEYMLRPGEKLYEFTGKAEIYLLAAPGKDASGQLWSLHRPITDSASVDKDAFESYLKMVKSKGSLVVYDALYSDVDEEYRDARYWESL